MVEAKNTYNSGDMNTTGREPFETPFGDNANSQTGAGTGIGAGTGAQQPTTGQYGQVGGPGNVGVAGGEGHHHSHHEKHHERQEHSHHHHETGNTGLTGTTGTGHHDSVGGLGQTGTGHHDRVGGLDQSGTGHHDRVGGLDQSGTGHHDRVGGLDQNIGNYERTGASGPATTGAAGTDRFDSTTSGATTGVVTGNAGANDRYGSGENNQGGDFVSPDRKDVATTGAPTIQPGAGQNALGTSDKEFYDPSRKATSGAYTDDAANTKTALTGREGTGAAHTASNPNTSSTTSATTGSHTATGEKPGLIQKIKEML